MSKQTVTGVAEGHLLHKDFLVEYDPDERTWTVEREVPAEPTPEPGTAGTATVRGVEGVRVMRTDGTDGADEMWLSAVFILGYRGHQAEVVTDFVPDPTTSACTNDGVSMCPKMAYSNKQLQRDLAIANEHGEELRERLRYYEPLAPQLDPAAFVLPLEKDIRRAVIDAAPESSHKVTEKVTQAVRALLAEHAVTEERLREALNYAFNTGQIRSSDLSMVAFSHLTGKAS